MARFGVILHDRALVRVISFPLYLFHIEPVGDTPLALAKTCSNAIDPDPCGNPIEY